MSKTTRPPGPKGRFLLGHLPEMQRDLFGFYSRCAREYGDCSLYWQGWLPVWLLNHPDLIRQVLVTEAHNFQKDWRYRILSRLLGNGLITSSDELWLRQRRLMQPAFLSRQVAAYGEDMVTLARAATDSWVDGEVRDVRADMARLTMAILVKTIFGMELRGRGEAILPAFADALRAVDQMIVGLWPLPAWCRRR